MNKRISGVMLVPLVFASSANAGLISGFEAGLDGWDYLGDVSIQTASIGIDPTQGHQLAFISTMCDRENPPAQSGCETTVNEHPYSGISSPSSGFAREFLGLPFDTQSFGSVMPPHPGGAVSEGESGALKTSFFAPRPGVLSFDWNRIGADGDSAYFTLWSEDPESNFRMVDWLFLNDELSFVSSDVELCSRYYDEDPSIICNMDSGFFNVETGWSTRSVAVPYSGWYSIGFGLGEAAEGTVPTVLALDRIWFSVPEPAVLPLFCLGLALTGIVCVRRQNSATGAVTAS